MIVMLSWLLAAMAVAALAAGTPRQTVQLFGHHVHEAQRRRIRMTGFALLGLSGLLILAGDDRGRALVGWIGFSGMAGLATALLFTGHARRR